MAIYTSLSRGDLEAAVLRFDLGHLIEFRGEPAGSINTNYRLRTNRGEFFLRLYEHSDAASVDFELKLLRYLAGRGFPSPPALGSSCGELYDYLVGKPVGVFPMLEGKHITAEQARPANLRAVGEALAKLHKLGRAYQTLRPDRYRYAEICRMFDELRAPKGSELGEHLAQLRAVRDELEGLDLSGLRLPGGLIHGDLFDDNVLFDDSGELTGVLDFEMAAEGRFIYDIAVAINAWCWRGDKHDGGSVRELLRGYAKVRALMDDEKEALYPELLRSAIRFTVTRIRDFHLRKVNDSERTHKDYREFLQRGQAIAEKGPKRVRRMAGFG